MKSSYIVIAVLAVVLLAGLAWMAWGENGFLNNSEETEVTVENETQPSDEEESNESNVEHKVVYTGSVFDPEDLTVILGDTVTFVNNSGGNMQVASNPHPQHTDLEGFESGILEPGDEYSFTFEEAGDWGYHDHLNPSNTGTIEAKEFEN